MFTPSKPFRKLSTCLFINHTQSKSFLSLRKKCKTEVDGLVRQADLSGLESEDVTRASFGRRIGSIKKALLKGWKKRNKAKDEQLIQQEHQEATETKFQDHAAHEVRNVKISPCIISIVSFSISGSRHCE